MDLQLHDRSALVCAASKGIGKAVALALAREGCRVIISSHDSANLQSAKAELQTLTGSEIDTRLIDVSSEASVSAAAEEILASIGGIDILVTNSPGPPVADAATVDIDALRAAAQTNCFSVVQLSRAFLPSMIARRFGRIINLTSTTGKEPDVGMVLSNLTRAAVLAYAKTLSREVAGYGITVNSILTGSVLTDRTVTLLRQDAEATGKRYEDIVIEAEAAVPAGYISSPQQFAHAIAFLASPLSMYINGTALPIDGGFMRGI